jgi:phosphate transport system permease protein
MSRRKVADTAARWVVGAGGMATIASIVAILGFITLEAAPLFKAPYASLASAFSIGSEARHLTPATDEYREVLEVIGEDGHARFSSLDDGRVVDDLAIPGLGEQRIATATRAGKDHVFLATSNGELIGIRLPFEVRRQEGTPQLHSHATQIGTWTLSSPGAPPALIGAGVPHEGNFTVVFALPDAPPQVLETTETHNLFGSAQRQEARHELPLRYGGTARTLLVNASGDRAYVGSTNGYVYDWDLRDADSPRLVDAVDATGRRDVPVTALSFLIGEHAIVVGDAAGRVSVCFPVRDPALESGWRLQKVHDFAPHRGAVTAIAASPRDRSFVTGDETGQVLLRHSTTERTLLELPNAHGPIAALTFSPKANGAIAVTSGGHVVNWDITNPHPEVTLASLFGKVWYEGYDAPAYVWQSTGGTDDFEAKLSLIPLILGTMKGTLYALFFAVPVAVMAALYTSQFSHPRVRTLVKPTVEIMAALPSVVLGFLAGLWLAPTIEGIVPAVLAMCVVVPLLMLATGGLWSRMPASWRRWIRPGMEIIVLAPLIVLGVQLCLWANPWLERVCFGGDFRTWLSGYLGLRFDQRNALIVGFAMGFAVIPIIFTISEDALSNVPQRLLSASLALGATPWQTAVRVVLPTASPGIFSAIMVGFGRAVGETMIVLMATGNTPVLDWNIFTGMRTLSANIAVEVPEAPYGGTLYRVLFLAALLLFAATFFVNTAAELVRQRLRQRYQRL